MNGIVIEKIEFENFRQYGTGSLSFSNPNNYSLSVIIAQNGIGKTTLLNAITWCLYMSEKHLPEGKETLPILNADVLRNSQPYEKKEVSVAVTISVDQKVIEFKRVQTCEIKTNDGGVNDIYPGFFKFTVATTIEGGTINTDIKEDEEAQAIVKQYFDEDICDFYFFDGEKLGEFFAAGHSDVIKESIFNISQVKLLERTINHLKTLKNKFNKGIGKNIPDLNPLLDQLDEFQDLLNKAQKEYRDSTERGESLKEEIERCNRELKKLQPARAIQDERATLEKDLSEFSDDREEILQTKSVFIRRYLTVLNLYPRIKATYDYIITKQGKGELPPSIDIDQVKKILEMHVSKCPMCDNTLTPHSIEFLQGILLQNSVSSRVSNYLSSIRDSLEDFIDEAKRFPDEKEKIEEQLNDIDTRIAEREGRLKDIGSLLTGYQGDEEDINQKIQEAERDRNSAQKELDIQNHRNGAARSSTELYQKEIARLEKEIENTKSKLDVHDENEKKIRLLDKLSLSLETVKDNIMADMSMVIESETWEIFEEMIWKKNTFGDLQINNDYTISIYNKDNIEMTGSLSATEQMALAYAYTLAIHQASGRNCPLVIDSPLGRVSDDNRENIAKVLLDTSREKQIIMLFTPDEYSPSVKAMYDGVAAVKELSLNAEEDYVKGVEA